MKWIDGEHILKLNGINHWVRIEGGQHNTIPLVIIHGGPGGNHYTFERIVGPLLSENRTIVYYEQRGCGRSERPVSDEDYSLDFLLKDFKELINWLDTKKVDLLGYSFGGELALEFAYECPEKINKIILSAPSLMNSEIQRLVQITGFMSVANEKLYQQIIDFQRKDISPEKILDKIWEQVDTETVDLFLFENQEIAKKNRMLWEESKLINTGLMMRSLQKHPLPISLMDRLKDIHQRVLIIAGVFDRNTGIPIAKLFLRSLPNSQLVVFDKSAHFPDLEETDKFVHVVREFLDD
ncbi:alpha/beta fold hydrolase [Heyndrickxia camelliae]|uniref:Proline iminopeptidase n=1 Tax=Heyndrickxia camelliae TaxID=1707093 RepID=A0A2N3LIM5_9BACI|nr:alpha/beta fold hydrolase [Heyndrickxia camelliae]PKR84445.1 proline iminopeptidase [Heyndrickxia camelliae]